MPTKSIAVATEIDVDAARAVLAHDFRRYPLDGGHELREEFRVGIQQGYDGFDGLDHEMSGGVRVGGVNPANATGFEDDPFGIGGWGRVAFGEQ